MNTPCLNGKLILVVDDEVNILNALRRVLRPLGAELEVCLDPKDAITILTDRKVDVIISDYSMPGMTGLELLARAKKLQPTAVRIMLTGFVDNLTAHQAETQGSVEHFITKPWDSDQLCHLLANILEKGARA